MNTYWSIHWESINGMAKYRVACQLRLRGLFQSESRVLARGQILLLIEWGVLDPLSPIHVLLGSIKAHL